MAVGEFETKFSVVPGVRLGSVHSGIKKSNDKLDLVLIEFVEGSVTTGIFTRSSFAAAPVLVARRHIDLANSRYFLVNSGNANAATGQAGVADAQTCCQEVSRLVGVTTEEVVPFSTGVIGERLPVATVVDALPLLRADLSESNWLKAARGIMTTDTQPKIGSRQFKLDDKVITITGIAKGAGMIQPNMATLLVYIATDAQCSKQALNAALLAGADQSFNRITVDSDTSTNDSCMLTATGVSGVSVEDGEGQHLFARELASLMRDLAHGIVRDAEGATKFIKVTVRGGQSESDCLIVAFSIANSPLVKTAMFASDANWGRIVMAIGKTALVLDQTKIDLYIGDVLLMSRGEKNPDYVESMGAEVMSREEITISVNLNVGNAVETVWTSDLSQDYVAINADYRS